uniref:Uncharacterized protein n=1 Tax=Marseillevirus LCMAC103 TaxID=2506604 RepID=A0A481YV82_9VIRU|nr:MAG: hypothetical protein LCMAC103_01440 [Marseillevirus LCMAC103]
MANLIPYALFTFYAIAHAVETRAEENYAMCVYPGGTRANYTQRELAWVEDPSWIFAKLGYGPTVPDVAPDDDTVVCTFVDGEGTAGTVGHEYGALQLEEIDRARGGRPPQVELKANKPNGFDRREHSLARPRDKVKSQTFQLGGFTCRPVFITEKVDGSTSDSYHKQIYVRVTSDNLVSVSLSGGKPEEPQSPSSQTMPMTKFAEYMTYWPNLVICNLEDAQIEFTVEYANAAPTLWTSPAAFLATVLLVAQFVALA